MPTQFIPGEDDGAAVMATIGHICIQWSRLESTLLAFCAVLTRLPPEEAFIVFGGLDMRPRMNMAINLARYHKMHPPLLKRLIAIRETMGKEKIDEKRNQAVHGVHADSSVPHHVHLTMPRWPVDKRFQNVSILDLHNTGSRINDLANECYSIFHENAARLGLNHGPENISDTLMNTNPTVWDKIKQHVRALRNHIIG